MSIRSWSTTAANNNSAPPNGWPEGMAPSGVNNSARQMMADVRDAFEQLGYFDFGDTPTRVDADTFTVSTDLTARYSAGKQIKLVGATTEYGIISSSSYSAPNTTVEVTGTVPTSLTTLSVQILAQPEYRRTAAEIAASVTPVNYFYPPGHLDRYVTNSTPGTTDCTTGMQSWALLGGSHELTAGVGPYKFVSQITFANDGTQIRGLGRRITTFQFDPATNAGTKGFVFSDGANVLFRGALRDCWFKTTNNNQKDFISLIDTSGFIIDNVEVYTAAASTSNNSVGLYLKGRELTAISNFISQTDYPLRIGVNPNSASLSCDLCSVRDSFLYVISNNGHWCITVDDNVNITNLVFDGHMSYGHGSGVFYWDNATSAQASYHVHFKGTQRYEQADTTTDYTFYINMRTGNTLQSFSIDGFESTVDQNCLYLRYVRYVSVANSRLAYNARVALNADSTVLGISIQNVIWTSGSTATLSGQFLRAYFIKNASGSPLPETGWYDSGATLSYAELGRTRVTGTASSVAAIVTDGTRVLNVLQDTSGTQIYNESNHALGLGTNNSIRIWIPAAGLGDYANDAAAAAGGVAIGHMYRNGSVLMIRVA